MLTLVRQCWETIFFYLWLSRVTQNAMDLNRLYGRFNAVVKKRLCTVRRLFDIMAVSLQALSTEDLLEKLKEAGIRH